MEKFKKDKLRMYAFLTACFIILVLLNSIGVFADSNNSIVTEFGVTSDDVLNQNDFNNSEEYVNGLNNIYVLNTSPIYTNAVSYVNNDLYTYPSSVNNTFADTYITNHTNFVLVSGDSTSSSLYLIPDSCFCSYESSYFYLYVPLSFLNDNDLYNAYGEFYISRFNFLNGNYRNYNNIMYNTDGQRIIDGVEYKRITITSNNYVLMTSLPIYYNGGSTITTLSGVNNINYSSLDSGSSSDESASNNLDLPDGDWSFKNSSFVAPYNVLYNTGSVYPSGNITFSYTPSDYQVEHASDFTLTFGFTFDYDVNYKNWGGSDVGPFIQTSELTNNQKNYSAHWYYSDQGVEYIDVSLSDFISSGNSKSYTFYDILKNMGGGTYSYETVLLNSKELEYVSYNKFNITCTAFISSGNESSGNITEWYNPMNKKGYTTDESGKVNKNPYSDDSSSDVTPSGSGAPGTAGTSGDNSNNIGGGSGNSSATASNGSIVINNTNNNSANGGSGTGSGGGGSEVSESAVTFYTTFNPFKLIFNKLIGDNETISDETADTIGSNSFITLLSSTFTFIPSGVLTYLTWFFGACLSILIVAIVLRVLLDLL